MARPVLDPRVAERVRTTGAAHRTLTVVGELADLLGDAIQRGVTVAVTGPAASAAAVGLQLAAGPSGAGSWVGAVGLPDLGLVAASEAGIALERFALVHEPGASWPEVVAALVDGFDLVLARCPAGLRPGMARRLVARARERGTVLVGVGGWPEGASLRIEVAGVRWEGLETGHLRSVRRRLLLTGRLAGQQKVRSA